MSYNVHDTACIARNTIYVVLSKIEIKRRRSSFLLFLIAFRRLDKKLERLVG